MTTKQKFKSDVLKAIHRSASALHKVGAIDKATMREFDASCIATVGAIAPQQIKRIREAARVSQPVSCALLEHQRVNHSKVGDGHQAP